MCKGGEWDSLINKIIVERDSKTVIKRKREASNNSGKLCFYYLTSNLGESSQKEFYITISLEANSLYKYKIYCYYNE